MTTVTNPNSSTSITIEGELAQVAEQLRQVTVQVQSGTGGGSGLIWRSDGLIVTNAHVTRESEPAVTLADGRRFRAKAIARDSVHDLASFTIPATGLDWAKLRDPSTLRTGEMVVAIGNPLGSIGALATGILHASPGPGWIQADIRLAPGNSGGPLADVEGKVIGLNSRIVNGLALAVSTRIVERFVAGETRARLGVTVQPTAVIVWGEPIIGLLIVDVESNSPACVSGLRHGDVLLAAGGMRFRGVEDLAHAISTATSSGALLLDVVRAGSLSKYRVKMPHD